MPPDLEHGRRLVLGGLAATVLSAATFAGIFTLVRAEPPLGAYVRALIVLLLALAVYRGRDWAQWLLGMFALAGATAALAGARAVWPVAWASAGFVLLGTAYLGGYVAAVAPPAARAFLERQGAARGA